MTYEDIELSDKALEAIDKVEKLLALARDAAASEGEATNAMNLAQRILDQHNLDMALVEARAGASKPGKRNDQTNRGGLYKWQRAVWESTAKLNMCHYQAVRGLAAGSQYEQRLIGRKENVIMTKVMAQYLQDTIERMAAEWAKENGYKSRYVRDAIIYREGMAETICGRLSDLRYQRIQEAKRKAEEARAAQPQGTGTDIVLSSVIQSEEDLNNDYLQGWDPGTTARRRAENEAAWAKYRVEVAEKERQRQARMLVDPEFAIMERAREEANRKAREKANREWDRRYARRKGGARETAEDRRRNHWSHHEGREAGYDVNLDQQIDKDDKRRIR